jgi:hypothetical protein
MFPRCTVELIGVVGSDTLRWLGTDTLTEQPDFGASLALGSADVTLLSLANACRALASSACRPARVVRAR